MTKAKDETPEQRENRLIKARKQAGKTREQAMKEKYRDKILEDLNKEAEAEEVPEPPVVPPPTPAPAPAPEPVPVVPVKKPRKKAATKIIVEQDSDDSDYFEDKPNIIFVKRIAKKKETPVVPVVPAPVNVPAPVVAPYIPRSEPTVPPKPPPMTAQQRLLVERYNNMARGNFLPMSRPR